MTNPTFRALCAELHQCLEYIDRTCDVPIPGTLLDRARAALAQPEPVAPTVMELPMPAAIRDMPEQQQRWYALGWRAALARWGTPTAQPVPVSKRLPGPGDCDTEGRCWLCGKVEGDWRLINPVNCGVPQLKYCFSHWLPHWALPVPAPANNTREGTNG